MGEGPGLACEEAGSKRIVFLDLARGLAVFFMVMQHAVIVYAAGEGEQSVLGSVVLRLANVLGAPVFLIVMGVFLARSKSTIGTGI